MVGHARVGAVALPVGANDHPLFRPSRTSTFTVVAALIAAIIVIAGRANLSASGTLLKSVWQIFTGVLGGIARPPNCDFRYAGLFKRERSSRFAVADTRYLTPLCIAIAFGVVFVALR